MYGYFTGECLPCLEYVLVGIYDSFARDLLIIFFVVGGVFGASIKGFPILILK